MLCISWPGWPVAVPIRGVPRCLRYCGYVAPLWLLSPFGQIRKTKAMSAPQKSFFGVWIIPNILFYRGRPNIHCVGSYYSNWILYWSCFCLSIVLILRVFRVRRVYRGSIFFSLVLILRIPACLGIKGDQFFTDLRIFSGARFTYKLVYYNLYHVSDFTQNWM